MRSENGSSRVRVRNTRQPTGWTVPNSDLGDRHFRDKGPCPLHVLKSIDFPRFTAWDSQVENRQEGRTGVHKDEHRISELAAE